MESLLKAGTAVVADVFDSLGIAPPVLASSITPLTPGARFVGPAYPIVGQSITSGDTSDRVKLAAIDDMPAGVVAVWAGSDIRGVCCFGDLLAEAMSVRGCAGVVVDGGVRDVGYLSSISMPIFARYRTPVQSIGRWKVTAYKEPVSVPGRLDDMVQVEYGDAVVADEDGVIVVPHALLDDVTAKVLEWSGTEEASRAAIRGGTPLLTALEMFGHL
jgi:regulator of RNase E activity RraA